MKIEIRLGAENMDLDAVHRYLSEESYWARGISKEKVAMSIENSFCVGAFLEGSLVGFARLVTDYVTFAWLSDVFVLKEAAGKGVGKQLLQAIEAQDWVNGLRRFMLATKDAHSLYAQFGFEELDRPEMFMQRLGSSYNLL